MYIVLPLKVDFSSIYFKKTPLNETNILQRQTLEKNTNNNRGVYNTFLSVTSASGCFI